MTNEEAIEYLRDFCYLDTDEIFQFDEDTIKKHNQVIDKSIEALSQPQIIRCTECKYYDAPVCRLYSRGDMTSRHGYCYHAIRKEEE